MDVIKINKYFTPFGEIEFHPVKNMPGYSYSVYVNRIKRHDLYVVNGVKPDKKTAIYFARMIAGEREKGNKYYYVDKNIDPPTTQQWFADLCKELNV
jgi:hypothetical protein